MKMMKSNRILCVDDDADDLLFLSQAINDVSPETEIVQALNGIEALNYLNEIKRDNSPLPCLIVLDLNMPLLNGMDTFDRIKADPELLEVPVVVFTSSRNPRDKAHFLKFNVQLFTKPDNIIQFSHIVSNLLSHCRSQAG